MKKSQKIQYEHKLLDNMNTDKRNDVHAKRKNDFKKRKTVK